MHVKLDGGDLLHAFVLNLTSKNVTFNGAVYGASCLKAAKTGGNKRSKCFVFCANSHFPFMTP